MTLLRHYQTTAVATLGDCFARNLGTHLPDRLCVLRAPTGAGKTVMLAALLAEHATQALVLWATPGKGDLEEQSLRALRAHLTGTPLTVERLTAEYLAGSDVSAAGTVLVLNWEEVVQRGAADLRTGLRPWKNLLACGDEHFPGLFDHLAATAAVGTEVVVVIDESHYGRGSNDSAVMAFLQAVDDAVGYPVLRVEASATPLLSVDVDLVGEGRQRRVSVKLDDVIGAGMLAKDIGFNVGVAERFAELPEEMQKSVTGEQLILSAAWDKVEQLRREYAEVGAPVRPLLLVQLPNDTATNPAGQRKREMVERWFAQQGVTAEDGRLLVWLADEERDPLLTAGVADRSSPVDVLLFKQGISLGWDCPRAQVLVVFREMASDIFRIQTLGRILRTAERRHYDDPEREDLDLAFVYSNVDVTTHVERDPDAPDVLVEMRRRHPEMALPGSYASRAGRYDDLRTSAAREVLSNDAEAAVVLAELRSAGTLQDLGATRSVAGAGRVSLAEVMAGRVGQHASGHVAAQRSDEDLDEAVDRLTRELVADWPTAARSARAMRSVIYGWLRDLEPDAGEEEFVRAAHRLLVSDAPVSVRVRATLRRTAVTCRTVSTQAPATVQAYRFSTTETLLHPERSCTVLDADDVGRLHLYARPDGRPALPTGSLSEPEKDFVALIRTWVHADRIAWWWKNGEGSRKFFSLAYTNTDDEPDTTYPDFLVRFTDGHLLVAETKQRSSGRGPEFGLDGEGRNKAAALAGWAPEGVTAGVVYRRGERWLLAGTADSADDQELEEALSRRYRGA